MLSTVPFLNPQSIGKRNVFEKRWLNNILSKTFEAVDSMLIGLELVLSNGSSFLNIGVISAIFSSLGNLFCFTH